MLLSRSNSFEGWKGELVRFGGWKNRRMSSVAGSGGRLFMGLFSIGSDEVEWCRCVYWICQCKRNRALELYVLGKIITKDEI